MRELYIGLMSGTSMDGIDAALVEFKQNNIKLLASHNQAIPESLILKLKPLSLNTPEASIDMLGEADSELGLVFATAVKNLLKKTNFSTEDIIAIGSHGQTIRHRPDLKYNFSLQIGDANRISYDTGITTVADFRRKDMAAGGEGAPLAPAFHQQVFQSGTENRAILNIGGISNITFLPAENSRSDDSQTTFGFDTGPGNMLMDAWIQKNKNTSYDTSGEWAASAKANDELVDLLMQDEFISAAPPKSTGREHYHLEWLELKLQKFPDLNAAQVQASLNLFTCKSICYAIKHQIPEIGKLIVCGGGVHNTHLMNSLAQKLPEIDVESSEKHGVKPDWVEAIAFAWLARQTMNKLAGNLPAVTGAKQAVVLGGIYLP